MNTDNAIWKTKRTNPNGLPYRFAIFPDEPTQIVCSDPLTPEEVQATVIEEFTSYVTCVPDDGRARKAKKK